MRTHAKLALLLAVVVALAALLILVVTTASPGFTSLNIDVAQALDGSISGTVTDESTGDPLSDICVSAYDTAHDLASTDETDSFGAYSVGGLPSGDYKVWFRDCGSAVTHLSEWYDDKEDFDAADLVSVTAGTDTSGIDAALALGGSISGTVTDEATGEALRYICVTAYDTSHNWADLDLTDSSGTYRVEGLRTGDYKVQFWDCRLTTTHLSEWYDDKGDFDAADVVAATQGLDTGGTDAALALGGSILGTVTDEATGGLLSDICVSVYDTSHDWAGSDHTDSSGAYRVGGLPTGDYKVEFEDCGSPLFHISEWYDDKEDFDVADSVAVTQGLDTGGIDTALALGGSISGTVTDEATGEALRYICVGVYDISHNWAGSDSTDSSGTYSVGRLPPGEYKVRFEDCGSPAFHILEWYDDKGDFDAADSVSVAAELDTSGTDAALALGASISGTVTDEATGGLLSDICVSVYDTSHDWAGSDHTDSSGAYRVGGLPTGDYKVEFEDCGSPLFHISEWYDDKEDFDVADSVAVTQGLDTGGIDAALALGGSISGTVTDESTGDPLRHICVDVYDTAYDWAEYNLTDSSGVYSVGRLPPGEHKVRFWDCVSPVTYAFEWYEDKGDFDAADSVSVAAGLDTSGTDAALALGGSILGTVTDEATGGLLSDICVSVYDTSHDWAGSDHTDSSGVYRVGGLPTGDYKVEFEDCGSPVFHISEWYDDKGDFDAADPVAVTQGLDTGGIDAALALGGSISGTVADEATGDLLSDICVSVYDTSHNSAGWGHTDSSGTYSVGRLPPGEYKVRFEDCGSPAFHISEWYDDKGDFDAADLVSVTRGSDTGGMDAALALGGSISGAVADEATGGLVSDICVSAYDTSHNWAASDRTGSSGAYSVGGLPTGDYKVRFWDCGFPIPPPTPTPPPEPPSTPTLATTTTAAATVMYVSEWYDDKPDFDSADLVAVTQGFDTAGIDAALHCNTVPPLCGDVDCDDDVDAVDALFILQYVVGARQASDQCPPPEGHLYLPAGDVDCDDDVDAVDALFVLQHVVGLRPELCVCGITPTEIIIGAHSPLSGPYGAVYSMIPQAQEAYYGYVNDTQGGVCGRNIVFKVEDNGNDPAEALEVTKKLLEQDKVFAIVGAVGDLPHSGVWEYLNDNRIPDILVSAGAHKYGADPWGHPWTVQMMLDYTIEGTFFGQYISQNLPGHEVAILYENSDFGRDGLVGLKDGLDPDNNELVSEQSYEITDVSIRSQVTNMKNAGASVVVLYSTPGFTAQAVKEADRLGWHPQWFMSYINSDEMILQFISPELLEGAISFHSLKLADWTDDPAIAEHHDIMRDYGGPTPTNFSVYAQALAELSVEVFSRACDNLTRDGFMDAVESIEDFHSDLFLPGVNVSFSDTDHRGLEAGRMLRVTVEDGKGRFEYFGPLYVFEGE